MKNMPRTLRICFVALCEIEVDEKDIWRDCVLGIKLL